MAKRFSLTFVMLFLTLSALACSSTKTVVVEQRPVSPNTAQPAVQQVAEVGPCNRVSDMTYIKANFVESGVPVAFNSNSNNGVNLTDTESFIKAINAANINNLDLDCDGQVDVISVREKANQNFEVYDTLAPDLVLATVGFVPPAQAGGHVTMQVHPNPHIWHNAYYEHSLAHAVAHGFFSALFMPHPLFVGYGYGFAPAWYAPRPIFIGGGGGGFYGSRQSQITTVTRTSVRKSAPASVASRTNFQAPAQAGAKAQAQINQTRQQAAQQKVNSAGAGFNNSDRKFDPKAGNRGVGQVQSGGLFSQAAGKNNQPAAQSAPQQQRQVTQPAPQQQRQVSSPPPSRPSAPAAAPRPASKPMNSGRRR